MRHADYLIIGSSHAALSALHTLRMHDTEGAVTMVTRDATLPYSPTVLPYVVSGRSQPERVFLKDDAYFRAQNVDYLRGMEVLRVAANRNVVWLANGDEIGYKTLLVASGAKPVVPAIPGLDRVRYHVLRTLDDAIALHDAIDGARRAVVLGAGLVGMHAAENLAHAGASVTIVEREPHVLPGYFDAEAAAMIARAFAAKGVRVLAGTQALAVAPSETGCSVALDSGESLPCDLLVVGVGVAPVTGFLQGSGVDVDRGVLVDDTMRSSVANIYAAGDVAQARGFYDGARTLNGILPDAVEQGRIAGMAMAGDSGVKPYPGGVPLNTYTFFGQHAVSVGIHGEGIPGAEVVTTVDVDAMRYLKIVLKDDRLLGVFGINAAFDPGVMWELILRRTDLGPVRERFLRAPQDAARVLMSRTWR
jgi:phenylglyoxylate dehydrogenase epsilon subunit